MLASGRRSYAERAWSDARASLLAADELTLIDEAMLSATSGELSPTVTGLIYCIVIAACTEVYAFDRAREWTSALTEWCDSQPQLRTFAGACLVHRAELVQLGGDEALPGLALLRLAQGKADLAASTTRRVLSATSERLQRVRYLPAH